jgi:hypothetical protein
VAQRGRPGEEHGGPGALQPAQLTGVVDEDTWMHHRPLASADPPGDVGGAEAGTQRLATGDQPALVDDDPVHFEHDSSLRRSPGSRQRLPAHLWTTA